MKAVLYDYDIFPKVFIEKTKKVITIMPLGNHAAFALDNEYTVSVTKLSESNSGAYPERNGRYKYTLKPENDGCLRFECSLDGEGEYSVVVLEGSEGKHRATLSIYALAEDMKDRIPLRGDLHMHTNRSDGREAPAIVAANYRGHGYDFMVISDHGRYYPSLEAIEFYKDITDFNVVPGEEVHLPLNDAHYVNFGGTYSINALVKPSGNDELGDGMDKRSINGKAPDPMSHDEFCAMIRERAKSVPREHESERLSFAVMQWIYEHIQAGDGLGIFPHPYWMCPMFQLPEEYTEFVYREKPFDAFEVLGGENYYQHNGFQTAFYYDMKAKGIDHPVVGSTDSHGSTEHYRNALICSTIVFAKANERKSLIEAIKDRYSVAVDTISAEYRLVGDFRLIKYASFLMENYFPIHDLACKAEGYYMKQYACGDKRAEKVLASMKGQIPEMQKKYFEVN